MKYSGTAHHVVTTAIKKADNSYFFEDYSKQAREVLQALTQAGYAVVPAVPTEKMIASGTDAIQAGKIRPEDHVQHVYSGMIKAGKHASPASS